MKLIKEKTAFLAKQKGFKDHTRFFCAQHYYLGNITDSQKHGKDFESTADLHKNNILYGEVVSVPTIQHLTEWLMDEKGLMCGAAITGNKKWYGKFKEIGVMINIKEKVTSKIKTFNSYHEALEDAQIRALKYI